MTVLAAASAVPRSVDRHAAKKVRYLVLLLAISASAGVQTLPALAADPLDRMSVEHARLVNTFGEPVGTKISANQQVQVVSDIKNNQDRAQPFIYVVQIKDADHKIVSLSWISSNLNPGQVMSPALSWTPQSVGRYDAEIFVWDGFRNQSPLVEPSAIQITIS